MGKPESIAIAESVFLTLDNGSKYLCSNGTFILTYLNYLYRPILNNYLHEETYLLDSILSVNCYYAICAQSKYDNKEAFNPQFYPYPGNDFRSASGEPGPNTGKTVLIIRSIARLIQATHRVTGEVEITYTNNSPDNLKFLWFQLDQNIYKKDSRGSATTTEAGGRWANAKFTEGDVIKSVTCRIQWQNIYS